MNLWIRSQDKKILEKVNKLYVSTYNEEKGFGIYDLIVEDIDDCDVPLGFYKSKERALEVLSEIQNIINAKTIIKFNNFVPHEQLKRVKEIIDKNAIIELPSYEIKELVGVIVYEMPTE